MQYPERWNFRYDFLWVRELQTVQLWLQLLLIWQYDSTLIVLKFNHGRLNPWNFGSNMEMFIYNGKFQIFRLVIFLTPYF